MGAWENNFQISQNEILRIKWRDFANKLGSYSVSWKWKKRPFPSSKSYHFQNQAKWETFLVKMSFIRMRIKNVFISMALHLASLWDRGLRQLWNSQLKVMLHGTIRNDDFSCNKALQCWTNVATIPNNVVTMLQLCVALKIVVANRLV